MISTMRRMRRSVGKHTYTNIHVSLGNFRINFEINSPLVW